MTLTFRPPRNNLPVQPAQAGRKNSYYLESEKVKRSFKFRLCLRSWLKTNFFENFSEGSPVISLRKQGSGICSCEQWGRLWGCNSGVRFALTFLSKQIAECYTSCRRRRVRGLLQGCSKRLFPGWENIWWKICVFLPARGKQNETSSPDFTQPGAHRLEIPCTPSRSSSCQLEVKIVTRLRLKAALKRSVLKSTLMDVLSVFWVILSFRTASSLFLRWLSHSFTLLIMCEETLRILNHRAGGLAWHENEGFGRLTKCAGPDLNDGEGSRRVITGLRLRLSTKLGIKTLKTPPSFQHKAVQNRRWQISKHIRGNVTPRQCL